MRRAWATLAGLLVACGAPPEIRRDPPWSAEQWAVLVELDAAGEPLASSLSLVAPGDPVRVELDEDRPQRLYALAWDRSLEGCTFDAAEGELPSRPDGRWESEPIGAEGTIAWRSTERTITVRGTCPETTRTCADVEVTTIDVGPTHGSLYAVHAFRFEAYVGGSRESESSTVSTMMLVSRAGHTTLRLPEAQGTVVDMADAGDDIVAGTELGDLIRLRPTFESLGRLPGGMRKMSAIESGTLLVQRASTTSPSFAELQFPARTFTLREDVPDVIRQGVIAAPDVEYLVTEDGQVMRGDRQGRFTREVGLGPAPEVTDLAATASAAVVSARYTGVYLRDLDGVWTDIGRPPGLVAAPRAIGLLSRNRVVMGAYAGGIAIWDAGQWCVVPTEARENINALDVATDERTVWLVGNNADRNTAPLVIRVVAPP